MSKHFPKLLMTLLGFDTTDDIATIFYNQLKLDYEIINSVDNVTNGEDTVEPRLKIDKTSDYCFYAPRVRTKNPTMKNLAKKICFKFFPIEPFEKEADISIEEKETIMRHYSYIRYDRLLAAIRKYKKQIIKDNENINKKYLELKKTTRNSGNVH